MKNNKLIAEFIGLKIITDDISWFDTSYKPLKEYDKSWDSLMPVVEFIRNKGYIYKVEDLGNSYKVLFVSGGNDYSMIHTDLLIGVDEVYIIATHKAVVKFIEWYNEHHK